MTRIAAGIVLLALIVAGLAASPIVGWLGLKGPGVHDPAAVNLFGNPTGPNSVHPLGVDHEGRDVLSRMLFGLRSMLLLSLAGAGLGLLAAQLLHAVILGAPRLRFLATIPSALSAFPPLLLGLALAPTLGAGAWRLIVVLAITQVGVVAPSLGQLPSRALSGLLGAMGLDFGLTFLGDVPSRGPQLGAMVHQAGTGIVAGVPQWWALVFPGLLVGLVMLAGRATLGSGGRGIRLGGPLRRVAGRRRFGAADTLAVSVVRLVLAIGISALMLRSLGSSGADGRGALAAVGPALAATVSLLGGGAAVWGAATLGQIWLAGRPGRLRRLARVRSRSRRRRLSGLRPGAAVAALLSAGPVGWLGFLALFAFSDSVGQLPFIPGAGGYVSLTHDVGHWAEALIIPWLLLGLGAAARLAPQVNDATARVARSAQQRVARAAGVPERRLAGQIRRSVIARVSGWASGQMGWFLGAALILEVAFVIPGAGRLTVLDFQTGAAATVSDVTVIAAAVVILADCGAGILRLALDPGAAR